MRKTVVVLITAVLVLALTIPAMAVYPGGRGKGFDAYGYNYNARLFNGLLGNADRDQDGDPDKLYGADNDEDYMFVAEKYLPVAGTHLVMKWSKAWDDARFHGGKYTTDAWMTNHDTWTDASGKRHTAFLKVVWIGTGGNLYGGAFQGTVQVFK